jgi:uncharacterized protein (DUF2062 family)
MSRFQRWVARNLPRREDMADSRWIRPFASRVMRPELWRFTRRSVPRGVALGALVGIVIPFAQILFAAILALPVRANVPVAALTTFITNPFTTPFVWLAAYEVGSFILRIDAMTYSRPIGTAVRTTDVGNMMQWLTGAATITAFGLVVLGVVVSAVLYVVTALGWRWFIGDKWRRQRRGRGDKQLEASTSDTAAG